MFRALIVGSFGFVGFFGLGLQGGEVEAWSVPDPLWQQNPLRPILRKKYAFHQCYAAVLKKNPQTKGKMIASWTIRPDGRVQGLTFPIDTTQEPSLQACIRKIIQMTRFPRPSSGGSLSLSCPFRFVPAEPSLPPPRKRKPSPRRKTLSFGDLVYAKMALFSFSNSFGIAVSPLSLFAPLRASC